MAPVRLSLVLGALIAVAAALDNGLGLTPQMGWNSWNHFACDIHEDLIRKTADAIVSTGLAAAGYTYINLDDCWQSARDPQTGQIIADPKAFPSGIKALADYVHSKGLKLGLYSDAGLETCANRPGSLGYEEIDAQTYASWGVDYLKYDNCNTDGTTPMTRYPPMRDALNKTGRQIFFSMCEWGFDFVSVWGNKVGNSWRTTPDIKDYWRSMWLIIQYNDIFASYAGPGGWNDPDMLEVGNGGMTMDEYHTHFSLWALAKAPLIIGNDVTNMTDEVLDILSAPEIIAVNQDPLGVQGRKKHAANHIEVWSGPLQDGSHAVVIVNAHHTATEEPFILKWEHIGIPKGSAVVRDLWARKNIGTFVDQYTIKKLGAHASVMLRITHK